MSKLLLDRDWRFLNHDFGMQNSNFAKSGNFLKGPQGPNYDDSFWQKVDIPHDYTIDGVPTHTRVSDSDFSNIPAMQSMDGMLTTNGSLESYKAWYRKHFSIDKASEGKRIFIRFDGVYRDSTFFINGFYLDRHLSGYTAVTFDVTDFLVYGGDNVLSVKVDPRIPEGWWYDGAGIYRHVWLIEVPAVYTLEEDVFVKTEVNLQEKTALLKVETTIHNTLLSDESRAINYSVVSPQGRTVLNLTVNSSVEAHSDICIKSDLPLSDIMLWSDETPNLYRLTVEMTGGISWEIPFGLRTAVFDKDKGFILNGKQVKLKGVCCHQDHAGIGTAMFDGMQEYRLKKLKEMGCNAYRTSHNPPTTELLDACDRLGILVMDETRILSSSPEDLRQLKNLVVRARNHPSVIIYSIGNEEVGIQFKPCAAKIARTMKRIIQKLDGTRPVTEALLYWDCVADKIILDTTLGDELINEVDVLGVNYGVPNWDSLHERHPDKPFIITEAAGFPCTRGIFETNVESSTLGMFDKTGHNHLKGEEDWAEVAKRDYVSGLFVWTGFDYRGEPTPFKWPAVSSQFGILDSCGFKKDIYYYYRAWWKDDPVIHIAADLNDGVTKKEIWCFTNCEEAELFVNGKSCGKRVVKKDSHLVWNEISYSGGEIKAIGYSSGKAACEDALFPCEKATDIVLTVDGKYNSGDGRSYAIVNISATDKNGFFVADGDSEMSINTENCRIIGTGNGNPQNHTNAKSSVIRLFNGYAQVILEKKTKDAAELTVISHGLKAATVSF